MYVQSVGILEILHHQYPAHSTPPICTSTHRLPCAIGHLSSNAFLVIHHLHSRERSNASKSTETKRGRSRSSKTNSHRGLLEATLVLKLLDRYNNVSIRSNSCIFNARSEDMTKSCVAKRCLPGRKSGPSLLFLWL